MFEDLFSKSGLSLERLKSLCEIAAAGGIAKAAGGDPVRQSQFSRQIRELEEHFGVELTTRKGRQVVLTDAGRELVTVARQALTALSDFGRARQGDKLHVSLGGGDSLLQWIALPRLPALSAGARTVVFNLRNLRTTEVVSELRDAQLDFGLVRLDAVPRGLKAVRIGTLTYSLFVSPRVAVAHDRLGWEEAMRLPFVGLEGESQLMERISEAARRAKIKLRIELLCHSMPAVAEVLKSQPVVAVLPSIARKVLPKATAIEITAPCLGGLDRVICLAWNPRQSEIRPAIDKLRAKLIEELRF
jgi:DNA-binding transcriptional LysR family regulator